MVKHLPATKVATNGHAEPTQPPPRLFENDSSASMAELARLTSQTLSPSSCPLAATISNNVPIYDCATLDITTPSARDTLMSELYNVLLHGPGVLVLRNMYPSTPVLSAANTAFDSIIASELAAGPARGDHFSSGANARIWNSFSKLCLADPACFVSYFSNPMLALVCEAYLGPAYRITAQVNVVRPGGQPQTAHRDYHLGFQEPAAVARWPRALHVASQLLTLQGAVAQTDMPLASGPTRLLPYSQLLEDGYLRYRDAAVQEFFLENYVSLPLKQGDGLFFNPALYHAAGANETKDFHRSANLLQISSAFGRPMEMIDSLPLVAKTWDILKEKHQREGLSDEVKAFVQAVGEGNPFPLNLDHRPPGPGRTTPDSEQDVLLRGLREDWDTKRVMQELEAMEQASRA